MKASGDSSARAAAVTGRGRRLLAASSAAIVVVVAAVAVTWMVQRGNATAAPRPTPNTDRTHAIDGPGPATPSASPSTAASVTTSAAPTTTPGATTPGATTTAARGPAAPATPPTTSAKPAPAPAAGGTVRDDFSGTALAGRWNLYSSADSNGGIKSPKQVRVRNGELQILGQGTNASGKGNRSGGMCWCGSGDRLYGVWKVRARFDAGAGYAQGIGLWPASDNGKEDGHITIGISVGADKTSSWHSLIAPGGKSKGGTTSGNFTAWHVYAVEWRASFVRILIDGRAVFDSRSDAPGLAIPRTPQHLILQQDIGPQGNIPAPNSGTPGTVIMHVDWMSYSP